jgi:hypothetical protein
VPTGPARPVGPARPSGPVRPAGADRLVEYRRLVTALTAASARRAADLETAERAYARGTAEAEAELTALTTAADRAERWAAGAAAAVVAVDREADRLWAELRRVLGWRGALLGDTPAPADPDRGASGPALLARAARAVDALRPENSRLERQRDRQRDGRRRAGVRRRLPWWVVVTLLPALGATVAAAVALAAGGLVTLGQVGGRAGEAMRLLGYLTFLIAPFTGLPAAAAVAGRRFGGRLDAGGVALTVLGGMIAGCAIALALR